eukprot:194537-Rhodomonas_salina.2
MQSQPVGPEVHHARTQKETVDEEEEDKAAARDDSLDFERSYEGGRGGGTERDENQVSNGGHLKASASPAQNAHRKERESTPTDEPTATRGREGGGAGGGHGRQTGGGTGAVQKQNQDTGGAAAKVGGKTVRFCVNWGG